MPMFRDLEELAPDVFMFPRDETPNAIQPNIGVIRLKDQTILIDAGNSPRHANQILAAMAGQNFAPIETIIYTHHHWDHTFAAASFKPSQVIAHHRNAEIMAEYAQRQWSVPQLQEALAENPRLEFSTYAMIDAISDWQSFQIIEPTLTFGSRLTLYYEEMTLELVHVGGRHAPDSIVVGIPQSGVIFLGDSYYPPPLSTREPDDDDLALDLLDDLLNQQYELYIDGHGPPRTHRAFHEMIQHEKKRQGV